MQSFVNALADNENAWLITSRTVRVMRVKHKRGIKREKIPGDSKRVVPRIMSDPSRNMRDHVPGLLFKVVTIQTR